MKKSKTLAARFISQGWIAAAAMLSLIALSLFDPLHNPQTQHMSELISASWWSAIAIRVLPAIAGLSVAVFGLGCLAKGGVWSGLCALLFGAGMVSNGVVPMGSPLHGLYGAAVASILLPACFAAEFRLGPAMRQVSLAVAFIALAYLWALALVGLDPPEFRGLTQRAASFAAFGWFALAARASVNRRTRPPAITFER